REAGRRRAGDLPAPDRRGWAGPTGESRAFAATRLTRARRPPRFARLAPAANRAPAAPGLEKGRKKAAQEPEASERPHGAPARCSSARGTAKRGSRGAAPTSGGERVRTRLGDSLS